MAAGCSRKFKAYFFLLADGKDVMIYAKSQQMAVYRLRQLYGNRANGWKFLAQSKG